MWMFLRFLKYLRPFLAEVFDHTNKDTRLVLSRTLIIVLIGLAVMLLGYVYFNQRIDYLEKDMISSKERVYTLEHTNTKLELKYEQLLRDFNGRGETIATLNKALEKCQSGRENDAEIFRTQLLKLECKHTLSTPPKVSKSPKPPKTPSPTTPPVRKTPGRLDGLQ